VTKNYSILMLLPLTIKPERLAKGQPVLMFEKDLPSEFWIIPRHYSPEKDKIAKFFAKTCYVFHVGNAFEEGDEVHLYAFRSETTDVLGLDKHVTSTYTFDPKTATYLYKWSFDMKSGKVQEGFITEIDYSADFPTINPKLVGRKNRFIFAATIQPGLDIDGIIKYDIEQKSFKKITYGKGKIGGEPLFVPKQNSSSEDDGYLL